MGCVVLNVITNWFSIQESCYDRPTSAPLLTLLSKNLSKLLPHHRWNRLIKVLSKLLQVHNHPLLQRWNRFIKVLSSNDKTGWWRCSRSCFRSTIILDGTGWSRCSPSNDETGWWRKAAPGAQATSSLSDQPVSSKRRLRSAQINRKAQRASLYLRSSDAHQMTIRETICIDIGELNSQSPERADSPIWISNKFMNMKCYLVKGG